MTMERPQQHTVLHLKYNFGYITVILLVALLAVITYKFTPQPRFTEYLSNAATLASLLLALVAIIYSFISSEGVSKNLGQITSVANEVRDSRDEISKFIETAKGINGKADQGAQLFLSASEQVKNELASLGSTLQSIEQETKALEEVVKDIPSRLNTIEDKFNGIEKSLFEKHKPRRNQDNPVLQEIDASLITAFLEKSSIRHNLLAIALVLAHQAKEVLSLKKFCTAILEPRIEGPIAFLRCMDAIGLISILKVEDSEYLYRIEHINTALADQAVDYLVGFISFLRMRTDAESIEISEDLDRKLSTVKSLFVNSQL